MVYFTRTLLVAITFATIPTINGVPLTASQDRSNIARRALCGLFCHAKSDLELHFRSCQSCPTATSYQNQCSPCDGVLQAKAEKIVKKNWKKDKQLNSNYQAVEIHYYANSGSHIHAMYFTADGHRVTVSYLYE
ncbi:SubName: Full=Uncharacterized protein {ECO:0000313/EMBL:CCA75667.1}; Flags: Fragment [Serendipita indica DSM 11827]|nr:SubName: Full=Uncharacterized protein {ECO:0000313/EMBL:CCA75667.1}; Flags: Fragment [Serendipita indica DSM 11827]